MAQLSPPRLLALSALLLAAVLVIATMLLAGGASRTSAELVEPASAEGPPAADEGGPEAVEGDLKPRPRVVEAVAPGQDPQSAPESSPAPAVKAGDDNVSPGAASDDDIRRELKDLGDTGGGASRAVLRPDGEAIAPVNAPPEV